MKNHISKFPRAVSNAVIETVLLSTAEWETALDFAVVAALLDEIGRQASRFQRRLNADIGRRFGGPHFLGSQHHFLT